MTRNEQYWIDRANRRMDGYQISAIKQAKIINRSYNQTCNYVQSEIAKILRHIGDEDSLAYEYRMKRLNALLAKTQKKMQELYGVTLNDTTEFLRSIIPEAYYHTIFDIAQAVGEQPVFSAVNTRLIDQIVNDQWSGKNYSQRIWWNTSKLSEDVQQLLTTAAMSGESIYKTSRRLSERFGESMNNSVRLIRTETTYSCNQAELASYEELDIDRYKYVATLDTRTSPICQKLDGQIFNTKDAKAGVNLPAMHPNCRSTTIAYFEDGMPEFRTARDKDGKRIKVPADMTYDEWYDKYIKPSEGKNSPQKPSSPSKDKDTTPSKPIPQRTPDSVPATVDIPAPDSGRPEYKDTPIPEYEAEESKIKAENPATIVNISDINSPEYREKFDIFNEPTIVRRVMCKESRKMLRHRTGTEFEDMAFINSKTGKYKTQSNCNLKKKVKPTKRMMEMLHSLKPYSVIAIHNHPTSGTPSIDDIVVAYKRKYKYGMIACHNGNLYRYRVIGDLNMNKDNLEYIDMLLDNVNKTIYNKDKLENKFEIKLKDSLKQLKENGIDLEVYLWK